ncbi:hypothetical protein [Saccharibacillus brassicae]|uniref:Uncharacterized protein n=1 Tax=Saccharibacillus brassicae TaxID=2583377 RepID=A0A4Y6UUX2_SACBS|nr:hypothetical protein [Saccharibacillus brassicae]QDH20358.1 hypothetical protein FFV09_05465 [Saccharibacillus brassicae]
MSEFSASYHLRTTDRQQVVRMIQAAGHRGFVFPETNGWVTFIVEGETWEARPEILEQNPGLLAHYLYMEDHGWALSLFEKDEEVFGYRCDWTEVFEIEKDETDFDLLRRLISEQAHSTEGLEQAFEADGYTDDVPPAYAIAQKLGWVYFERLSADNIGEGEDFANLIRVEGNGNQAF